jgi:cytochrome c-type biogenesis protein CcmH
MKAFVAVLVILALVFGLSFAFRSSGNAHPTQAEMEADLVCVTCHEPLDESNSPLAQQMKVVIRQKIAGGWTKKQIENYFVVTEGFGTAVLAVPSAHGFDLLAWLLPLTAIVLGALAVGIGARTWLGNRDDTGPPDEERMAPALERRVDQALEGFDT